MPKKLILAAAMAAALVSTSALAEKNWTPPSYKIYAQTLSDQIMKAHPDLLSVTFHGTPPGAPAKTYTMYAGSYPDRIGNKDDPDDVMIVELGITIVDPRLNRTKDNPKKFVMMMPLRDKAGSHIGLLVLAYKKAIHPKWGERQYFVDASNIRDALQRHIPSHEALFAKVD